MRQTAEAITAEARKFAYAVNGYPRYFRLAQNCKSLAR
jgi:hypothetical protein